MSRRRSILKGRVHHQRRKKFRRRAERLNGAFGLLGEGIVEAFVRQRDEFRALAFEMAASAVIRPLVRGLVAEVLNHERSVLSNTILARPISRLP